MITTFAFLGSGMPGVGVAPRGTLTLAAAGIPGVEFPDGAIGLAESPGGRLLASTVCIVGRLAFAALEFDSAPPPHAAARKVVAAVAVINIFIIL